MRMDIKEILADAIKKAALSAIEKGVVKEGELPDVLLEVPPQKEFCHAVRKKFKMQPENYSPGCNR